MFQLLIVLLCLFFLPIHPQDSIPVQDIPSLVDAMRKHLIHQLQQNDKISELLEEAGLANADSTLDQTDCTALEQLGINLEDVIRWEATPTQDTVNTDFVLPDDPDIKKAAQAIADHAQQTGDIIFSLEDQQSPSQQPKSTPKALEISKLTPPAPAIKLPDGVSFGSTFFLPAYPPRLVLGAATPFPAPSTATYSLSALLLGTNANDGTPEAQIIGLTPTGNQLNGQQIGQLAGLRSGVIASQVDTTSYPATEKNLFFVPNLFTGTGLIQASDVIVDAAGAAVTTTIAGLATANQAVIPPVSGGIGQQHDLVFLAVPEADKQFNDVDGIQRGIAVLQLQDTATTGTSFAFVEEITKANPLSLLATDGIVGFTSLYPYSAIEHVSIGAQASLWWDNNLNRLYVGLTDVAGDGSGNEGGVLNIAMGYFSRNDDDTLAFKIASIVHSSNKTSLFDDNEQNGIVGFYFNNTTNIKTSAQFIKTMRTSTGRSYLIFNSSMSDGTTVSNNSIYAIPLIDSGDDTVLGTMAAVGGDGVVANPLTSPTNANEMPKADQSAVRVGQNFSGDNLSDVFVVGDAIYASFSGPTNNGIYKSTAIFDGDGRIVGWTPQTITGGLSRPVVGAGLDTLTGNLYGLGVVPTTTDSAGFITQWHNPVDPAQTSLEQVIAQNFPPEQGGVVALFSFSDQNPGLTTGQLSLLVAVGVNKIALIQTGDGTSGSFQPVTNFDATKIRIIDGLSDIGPLTCVELACQGAGQPVYLHVGGFLGLKVLTLGATPLIALTAPTNTRKIDNFSNQEIIAIRQVNNAQVATLSRSNGVSLSGLDGTVTRTTPIMNPQDMTTVGDVILVGTATDVVWRTAAGTGDFASVAGINGSVMQLTSYSAQTDGLSAKPGNVYALVLTTPQPDDIAATDDTEQPTTTQLIPHVYRLAVSGTPPTVKVIDAYTFRQGKIGQPRPFLRFDQFRRNIATDGSLFFDVLGKHFNQEDYVRLNNGQLIDNLMGIDKSTNLHVGIPIIDRTFGAWIIPGDWGIRVNR